MLKPEISIATGVALAALVYGVYSHALPSVVDHRVGDLNDADAAAAERVATFTTAAVVSAVSLLAKDPTIFVLGGGMVVVMSFIHRHANMVNPMTGRATSPMPIETPPAGDDMQYAAGGLS